MRTLVLFVFHQYHERVRNFIDNCIFEDDNIDFLVIANNNSDINLPSYVKFVKRQNIGYDFGGWSDGLLTDNLYQSYDKFIFVNSSVIGPFLKEGRWTDIYLNGLKNNVKLFGSTINSCLNPKTHSHVQSYIFATDRETVEFLISKGIFSNQYARTLDEAVWTKEVRMSQLVVQNGWNIGCTMNYYKDVDFTFKNPSNVKFLDDIMFNQYRNVLWNEYELVFIKGNRGVII